ncbi:MFS transporter [Paraburkholderia sediminicola]|uniref:MFS transporter n=1 Tax=Paraburkholderia sediminicola TaxID=458836 RepID=UPI0038BBB5D3
MSKTFIATSSHQRLSRGIVLILAAASAFITVNMYYAQPLVGVIGSSLALSAATAGLAVTLTQLGYALGLLLIVPLGDLFENRRLILLLVSCCVISLLVAGVSRHATPFLAASLAIGLSSVAMRILFPYASLLPAETERGRVIGFMTSGQMLGIMLARPVASVVAHAASWHTIFVLSAGCLFVTGSVFWRVLPRWVPEVSLGYCRMLGSMVGLAITTRVLQRRAFYHAGLFASFSLSWTVVPLLLAGPHYRLSQIGIAWFSLVGAAGVVAAPIAGNVADRGWTRQGTTIAIALVGISYPLTWWGSRNTADGLLCFAAAGVLLGVGVTLNVVLGQRAIFELGAEHRSKLNGLFMTAFYLSGAAGSAIGTWAYARGGWSLASAFGVAMPLIAAIGLVGEFRISHGGHAEIDAASGSSRERRSIH